MVNILQHSKKRRQPKAYRASQRDAVANSYNQRRHALIRISEQNQLILKRLQDKRSTYSVTKWKLESQQHTKLLKNICEYPYQLKAFHHSSVSPPRRHRLRDQSSSRANDTIPHRVQRRKAPKLGGLLPELKSKLGRRAPRVKALCPKQACPQDNMSWRIRIPKNRLNKHIYLVAQNESETVKDNDFTPTCRTKKPGESTNTR